MRKIFESDTAEFRWYENPTLQQINDVAGEDDKVRFAALFDGRKVIVFPYDESPKEFLKAIGQEFNKLRSLHGIAQKAGVGWLVTKVLNMKDLVEDGKFQSSNWEWVNKFLNLRYFLKKNEPHPDEPKEMKKNLHLSLDKQAEEKGSLNKVSLKDFLDQQKHGNN